MRVLITGAGGSLGRTLVEELLLRGVLRDRNGRKRPVETVVGTDLRPASRMPADERYHFIPADLGDKEQSAAFFTDRIDAIFHLATVTSGMARTDFDLGMRVNIDATRHLLDLCKTSTWAPRFIYSSSGAVFGETMPQADEAPTVAPINSYGAQKAICELLVDDYTRNGFVSGCSLRLPTILVRLDRSATQTTDFASHIVREAIAGRDVECKEPLSKQLVVKSPRSTARALLDAHDRRGASDGNGAFTMPALRITVRDLLGAMDRIAGPGTGQRVHVPISDGGASQPPSDSYPELDEIIREYLADSADDRT